MSTTVQPIDRISHTYCEHVAEQFRPSQPGILKCNRCNCRFRSDDIRTNRRCDRCQRDVIGESDRRARFEGETGRVVRKGLVK